MSHDNRLRRLEATIFAHDPVRQRERRRVALARRFAGPEYATVRDQLVDGLAAAAHVQVTMPGGQALTFAAIWRENGTPDVYTVEDRVWDGI